MTVYTRRLQTMLSEEQYEALLKLAEETGKPLSLLIREAVEKVYFERTRREHRRAALKRLVSMNAPVTDWEQMETEMIRGALQ
ncbi:MAG: ribbon-helix-helix domain-containing protein [Chloroflexi bacterium]|nr:ribbon-helix-helix domain-containing protein [Chloroflexota bacterium]